MGFKKLKNYLSRISLDCWAVCLYFLCMPFTVVTTPMGSLLKLVTMPVTAILIYKLFIGKRKKLSFNGVHFIYSLYIIYVIFGLFFLINDISVTQTKDMLLTYLVMMIISIRVYNEEEIELIESTWILVGVICTALAFTSSQALNEFENRVVVYILGFPEDPNQFCAYFIMPAMICMKRIVEKRKLTPFYLLLMLMIIYAVMKTGSRGGLVGVLLGIFACIILAVRSPKAKIAIIITAVFAAVIVVTVVFPLLPEDVQLRYSMQSIAENNGAGRFDIWKYLVNYAFENPDRLIHGSGLLSTYDILANANVVEHAGAAHNQFVQVLVDQGLLGLMLFIALIFTCFFRNWIKRPYYACAFAAVMVFSLSLTLYIFKPYINIIIMCALSSEKGKKNEIEEKNIRSCPQ